MLITLKSWLKTCFMNYEQLQNRAKKLAKEIVEVFSAEQISVAGAESCTGGAVASTLVSISGASKVFKGSAVCYCDEAKVDILGVSLETLKNYFAESAQCAREMAIASAQIYKSKIAFAITGFLDANIGENRPDNLKGKVFIAVTRNINGSQKIFEKSIKLDPTQARHYNRTLCVISTLELILTTQK